MGRKREMRQVGYCGLSLSRRPSGLKLSMTAVDDGVSTVVDENGGHLHVLPPVAHELCRFLVGENMGKGWARLQRREGMSGAVHRHAEVPTPGTPGRPLTKALALLGACPKGRPMRCLVEAFERADGRIVLGVVRAPDAP